MHSSNLEEGRKPPKIVQIYSIIHGNLFSCIALADDGAIWTFLRQSDGKEQWDKLVPPIGGEKREHEPTPPIG